MFDARRRAARTRRRSTPPLLYQLLVVVVAICMVAPMLSDAQKLRWCDYLHVLGVISDECMPDDSSLERTRAAEKQLQYPEYHLCQGRYGMCVKTEECESGIMCTQSLTNAKCCTSPFSDCPTVDELGYSCRKRHPTNWCIQDSDCSVGLVNRYHCCPTGCNYNVCVRRATMNAIQVLHAAIDSTRYQANDCPSYHSLKYRCNLASPMAVCYSTADCSRRNYGAYGPPRTCCSTPCGYNLCIARHHDNSYVIG